MTSSTPQAPRAYWSRAGLAPGIRAIAPIIPGTIAFGIAFGALCAQKQFTIAEMQAFMGIVYGGMSQFVAVQAWPATLTPSSIATLALLTLTVNIRFVLMGATLRPWFGTLPPWQAYPPMLLITDGGWLVALRYRAGGGADAAFYLGGAIALYLAWVVSALPGYLLAERLSDPKAFGLDMVFPAFFAALLVPAWRGPRRAIPWLVAGIVSLLVQEVIGGFWFIIAGSLAGAVTAGLMDDGAEARDI